MTFGDVDVASVAVRTQPARHRGDESGLERARELSAEGRYQDANPFAEDALRLGLQEFGPEHANTATLLNELA